MADPIAQNLQVRSKTGPKKRSEENHFSFFGTAGQNFIVLDHDVQVVQQKSDPISWLNFVPVQPSCLLQLMLVNFDVVHGFILGSSFETCVLDQKCKAKERLCLTTLTNQIVHYAVFDYL
jgi:hypothetical protein